MPACLRTIRKSRADWEWIACGWEDNQVDGIVGIEVIGKGRFDDGEVSDEKINGEEINDEEINDEEVDSSKVHDGWRWKGCTIPAVSYTTIFCYASAWTRPAHTVVARDLLTKKYCRSRGAGDEQMDGHFLYAGTGRGEEEALLS